MRKFKLKHDTNGYLGMPTGKIYNENDTPEGASITILEMTKNYPDDWEEVFEEDVVDNSILSNYKIVFTAYRMGILDTVVKVVSLKSNESLEQRIKELRKKDNVLSLKDVVKL